MTQAPGSVFFAAHLHPESQAARIELATIDCRKLKNAEEWLENAGEYMAFPFNMPACSHPLFETSGADMQYTVTIFRADPTKLEGGITWEEMTKRQVREEAPELAGRKMLAEAKIIANGGHLKADVQGENGQRLWQGFDPI